MLKNQQHSPNSLSLWIPATVILSNLLVNNIIRDMMEYEIESECCRILTIFWATVCKTVRPRLSDRCLSCLIVLSVTLVYCGQTVGWIKMKLGTEVGLDPSYTVLDGDPAPPQRGTAPSQFSAHVCCGQMAGWIKMLLSMEVGLGPGHIGLDGEPAPPIKGTAPQRKIMQSWPRLSTPL